MKKKLWLVLLIVGVVLIAVTVISTAAPMIRAAVSPQESIGIIGGADGPTAIYVTQQLAFGRWFWRAGAVLVGVFLAIGGIVLKITQTKK